MNEGQGLDAVVRVVFTSSGGVLPDVDVCKHNKEEETTMGVLEMPDSYVVRSS